MSSSKSSDPENGSKLVIFESEIEKAAARVLEKVLGGATDGFVATSANIFGGLVGDHLREWRTRNLVRHLARTAEFLKEKGISIEKARSLPMGELYSMFEEASKQDEPSVSNLWAGLLANAMNPFDDVTIRPAFMDTLKSLGGVEAAIMEFIWLYSQMELALNNHLRPDIFNNKPDIGRTTSELISENAYFCDDNYTRLISRLSESQVKLGLNHLIRERCILIPTQEVSAMQFTDVEYDDNHNRIEKIDHNQLSNYISSIVQSLNIHSGRNSEGIMLPAILTNFDMYRNLNYELTDYGKQLMKACH